MQLKDVLVQVDTPDNLHGAVAAACRLAERHHARLTGLYLTPPAEIPSYTGIETAVSAAAEARLESWVKSQAVDARARFDELTAPLGDAADWLETRGEPDRVLARACRGHDLLVMRQGLETDHYRPRYNAGRVALQCGRPVLVIPDAWTPGEFGRRILVAWNASRESARALHDAMRLLEAAQAVDVLWVNGDAAAPGADVSAYLARHAIEAHVENAPAHPGATGEYILERAAALGSDMIVMGAYGHSRFLELVLGGVTRYMLQAMPLPTLMSH